MPTIKQKKAFKELAVNGGNLSQAMRSAGYAENTAKRTDKLTRRKGWEELMEQHLSDKVLAKVHREGLQATTKKPHLVDRDDKGRPIYQYEPENDYSTRHKYLDSAYKLKGKYAAEKHDIRQLIVEIPKEIAEKSGITSETENNSEGQA